MLRWLLDFFMPADSSDTSALDLFLRGASIPAISAALSPGVGGPALLDRQRDIEDEIRDYIGELAETIRELRAQLGEAD